MTNYPITLNGTLIKQPIKFKISRYNLTKSGRVSSGKMTMEIKAKKRKFFLTYDIISGTELDVILDIIDTDEPFFTVGYYDTNGTYKTAECYVGEIPTELQRRGAINDEHYWKDVSFDLIEQ